MIAKISLGITVVSIILLIFVLLKMRENKKIESAKELGASKKEEKPTVWKESVLEKTEKEMILRTKKNCDILFCYNYHFCFSFSCGRCRRRWIE